MRACAACRAFYNYAGRLYEREPTPKIIGLPSKAAEDGPYVYLPYVYKHGKDGYMLDQLYIKWLETGNYDLIFPKQEIRYIIEVQHATFRDTRLEAAQGAAGPSGRESQRAGKRRADDTWESNPLGPERVTDPATYPSSQASIQTLPSTKDLNPEERASMRTVITPSSPKPVLQSGTKSRFHPPTALIGQHHKDILGMQATAATRRQLPPNSCLHCTKSTEKEPESEWKYWIPPGETQPKPGRLCHRCWVLDCFGGHKIFTEEGENRTGQVILDNNGHIEKLIPPEQYTFTWTESRTQLRGESDSVVFFPYTPTTSCLSSIVYPAANNLYVYEPAHHKTPSQLRTTYQFFR